MSVSIQDVLSRRGDLSTFLVHLTRPIAEANAFDSLRAIIADRRLRAATPMGWAKYQDEDERRDRQSQRTVCFSETPLQHVHSLFAEIEGRAIRLAPYGLAMTKVVARRVGINPIWYVDMTTRGGREWEEARALDELREAAIAAGDFHNSAVAKLLPFFEHMGTWPSSQKEFWWEREWRCRGDVDLTPIWSKLIWLCPEQDHTVIRQQLVASPSTTGAPIVLDPSWGLEEVIARLCRFDSDDVSIFHASAHREVRDGVIRTTEAA